MKFRLFGGLDCPDTVLAQLSVVANMPTALLSRMVDHVTTVVLLASKAQLDGAAAGGRPQETELDVQNATFFASADVKDLLRMDVAQALTALHTIVANIIRFNITGDTAVHEMSMLGLAAEAAEVIAAGSAGFSSQLRQALIDATAVVAAVTQPQAKVVSKTELVVAEGEDGSKSLVPSDAAAALEVQLTMQLNGSNVTLLMTPDKCRALLSELITARQIIKEQNVLQRE
jgi:hypothetical protein